MTLENNVENSGEAVVNGDLSATLSENESDSKPLPTATQQEIVFTDYIRKSLEIVASAEGFRNYDFVIDHGSSVGDGFVGVIYKVQIKENDSDKALTVLTKVLPESKARREQPGTLPMFEREVFVYNVLLPELVAFQKEKKITRTHGYFNFPKVYYADYDEELKDGIIIMEDLRDTGHRMWDKFKPIDLEHAKLLMMALGRLHALSFAMKIKKPEQFEKFRELKDIYGSLMNDEGTKTFLDASLQQALSTLDTNDVKSRNKFEGMMSSINSIMQNDLYSGEPYSVFNHGDCWVNNMLYHYTKRGRPEEIVQIDWQISRYCSPVQDLVYFIFICTDKKMRDNHFDELLNVYHRSLKELLDHLGGNTMVQFPFTALLRELKKFGKFGVMSACFIVPWLNMKNDELPDQDMMAEKIQGADQEVLDEMMKEFIGGNKEGKDKINERVRDIILDGIRYGYL